VKNPRGERMGGGNLEGSEARAEFPSAGKVSATHTRQTTKLRFIADLPELKKA
jgi:hypothetical protein